MIQQQRFRLGALVVLLLILAATILLWPLPHLGFFVDPVTGNVLAVQPDSAAGQGGMLPGDQIIAIYDYPWSAINTRLQLMPLPWQPGTLTPVTVIRDGDVQSYTLQAAPPGLQLQIERALRALLALTCWATGYLFGTSPRAMNSALRRVAWFWLALGGSLGLYPLLIIASYPLSVGLLWLQCTLVAPLAVAIHLWYPRRPIPQAAQKRARQLLLGAIGALQLGSFFVAISSPALSSLQERLLAIEPFVFLGSLGLSTAVLWQAYTTTTIAHIRRQIRLIGAACVLVACTWIGLLLIEYSLPPLNGVLPSGTLMFAAGIIPLAYLIGGVSADLMRVDQIAQRLVTHALAVITMLALLVGFAQTQLLTVTPTLALLFVIALYHPAYSLVHRLLSRANTQRKRIAALHQANLQLGTSLEMQQLATMMGEGMQAAFDQPPLAIYGQRNASDQHMELTVAHTMQVPTTVQLRDLEAVLSNQSALLPVAVVQQQLGQQQVGQETAALVFHPVITLWGVIRHVSGQIIGLVVVGPRRDLDPYRESDLRELRQTLAAASLAFTNSTSYRKQVAAEETIRKLYYARQLEQKRTAALIAREIHDEVLNVNVRLNIQSIQRLIAEAEDPELCAQLHDLLESEQALSQMLRLICEQLQPTSFDDPLGLALSLRQHVEQVRGLWGEHIELEIEHEPVPVAPLVHREIMRIAQEALANAAKHADATAIRVHLRFPQQQDKPIILHICDNGHGQQPIVPRSGHWGLHYMRESAAAIGATLAWQRCADGGTLVALSVPIDNAVTTGA